MNEFERGQLLRELQEVDVCEAEHAQAIPKACGFEAATRLLWLRAYEYG